MKELIAGIVLIVVVGLGGFLYRNMLERNMVPQPEANACTLDAKVCPDGSSVGRVAPSCEFAACPSEGGALSTLGVSLIPPEGYSENADALGSDATLVAVFEKPSSEGNPPHAIVVRRYAIPEGKTANDVMRLETMLEPSGMNPESLDEFKTVSLGGKTFTTITVERFEAQVHSVYYLVRATDVLRFEVLERGVTDWTEPTLDIDLLPEHAAFREMLRSMTVSS